MKLVEVSLQVCVAELVVVFKFAEIISLFLDSVICQMNEPIVKVLQIKFAAAGTDVAIFIEVSFQFPID